MNPLAPGILKRDPILRGLNFCGWLWESHLDATGVSFGRWVKVVDEWVDLES